MPPQSESLLKSVLQFLAGILVVFATGLSTYGLKQIDEIQDRVTTIEASRFTAKDGLEVWQAIAELKQQIAVDGGAAKSINERLDRLENDIRSELSEIKAEIRNRGGLQ